MSVRVALVTGAARGIGLGIARDLGADHNLAFTHHRTDPAALLAIWPEALAIQADLADSEAAEGVIAAVLARFGRLDVMVMNAGAVAPSPAESLDFSAQKQMLEVNLIAPMALLAAALPHLTRGASVINISSVNAVLPPMGAAAYGASKAALNLWTRGMAKELGPRGIRVNAVAPGAIERPESPRSPELIKAFVDQTALARSGTPQDIANAVRFLASDAAGFITGEVLTVSGGYRL